MAFKVAYEKPETSLIIEEDNIAKQSLDGDTPTDEFDVTNYSRTAQYGHVLQYAFYLQKNCGGPDLIYNLLTNTSNLYGTSFIDFILKQQGLNKSVCKSFENSFIAFQKARFAPKPYSNEDFISSMPLSGKIRTSQLENPPPFSAQAFKSKLCPKSRTQFFIDKDVCLKIRLGD